MRLCNGIWISGASFYGMEVVWLAPSRAGGIPRHKVFIFAVLSGRRLLFEGPMDSTKKNISFRGGRPFVRFAVGGSPKPTSFFQANDCGRRSRGTSSET